jgi:hypothetical protein
MGNTNGCPIFGPDSIGSSATVTAVQWQAERSGCAKCLLLQEVFFKISKNIINVVFTRWLKKLK